MSIDEALANALNHLQSGELTNEAQIKQAVILPVLRALGWDDADPTAFKPEYATPGGWVDYALLDHGTPLVFVEAKREGAVDSRGEEQLFRYANNQGVPLLVLSDGDNWDFFLSMAAGEPPQRRFHHLRLRDQGSVQAHVGFLKQHLAKIRVVSGDSKIDAERRLAHKRVQNRAREAIPRAWQSLLSGSDEMLCLLLSEAVETDCGTVPDPEDVAEYLTTLPQRHQQPRTHPAAPVVSRKSQSQRSKLTKGVRTPPADFVRPILQVLTELGGSAKIADVLGRVERRLTLHEVDRELLPSGGEIRWKNTARFARQQMVSDGLLKSGSRRGQWELTELGTSFISS